jgi:hypothetical protein
MCKTGTIEGSRSRHCGLSQCVKSCEELQIFEGSQLGIQKQIVTEDADRTAQ